MYTTGTLESEADGRQLYSRQRARWPHTQTSMPLTDCGGVAAAAGVTNELPEASGARAQLEADAA